MSTAPSFTCPDCRRRSFHPEDVRNCYCVNCHAFKAEPDMYPRCFEPGCPRFGSYDLSHCPDFHTTAPAKRQSGADR